MLNLSVDIRHWLDEYGEPAQHVRRKALWIARMIEYGGPLEAASSSRRKGSVRHSVKGLGGAFTMGPLLSGVTSFASPRLRRAPFGRLAIPRF